MEYTLEYHEPFIYLMERRKFLWWSYWSFTDEFSNDLEIMEDIISKL